MVPPSTPTQVWMRLAIVAVSLPFCVDCGDFEEMRARGEGGTRICEAFFYRTDGHVSGFELMIKHNHLWPLSIIMNTAHTRLKHGDNLITQYICVARPMI